MKKLRLKKLDDGNTENGGIENAKGSCSGIGNACGQRDDRFAGIGARVGATWPRSGRNPIRSATECVSYRPEVFPETFTATLEQVKQIGYQGFEAGFVF